MDCRSFIMQSCSGRVRNMLRPLPFSAMAMFWPCCHTFWPCCDHVLNLLRSIVIAVIVAWFRYGWFLFWCCWRHVATFSSCCDHVFQVVVVMSFCSYITMSLLPRCSVAITFWPCSDQIPITFPSLLPNTTFYSSSDHVLTMSNHILITL